MSNTGSTQGYNFPSKNYTKFWTCCYLDTRAFVRSLTDVG